MAQVLKESQRLRILEAARRELLDYGYRDASMRRIAAEAGMTAGNLYRYFENKDQLIRVITQPALAELDQVVRRLTNDRISLNQPNTHVGLSRAELQVKIAELAEDLAELAVRMPEEMRILMLHSDLSERISYWLVELLEVLAGEWSLFDPKREKESEILCRMFAASLFQGVRELFSPNQQRLQRPELTHVLQVYFGLFLGMLSPQGKGERR